MVEQRVERFCLHFENHTKILTDKFHYFLELQAFSDVTLICSKGRKVKAHKIVLAACSPFFESMLMKENSPVIILLDDITEEEIGAVLEFIYKGSLDIPRTFAPNFLRTGKRLQIRGLESYYNSEANQPVPSPSQKRTLSSPLSPVMRKSDNTVKAINPFTLQRRSAEDSDSTCSENELFPPAKTRKCQKQEEPVIHEAGTIMNQPPKEDDSDVELVEENPPVVVINESQVPDSPPWFRKTDPKSKRHTKSKPCKKKKDSSGTAKSTVKRNIADSDSVELVQASTSESQSTTIKTTVQKTIEKSKYSLTEEEFTNKSFRKLSHYCFFCNLYRRHIKDHTRSLHIKRFRKAKFTCQTCSKKFYMEYCVKNHTCLA